MQYLEGGSGGHETLLQFQAWMFPVAFDDLGCYLVESNQGHYPDEGMGFADDRELHGASRGRSTAWKTGLTCTTGRART